jgi:hypothetical protein
MRGELVAGRLFDVADSASGRRAVIVDDSLARAWPSENPVGQRVKVDLTAGVPESDSEWMDVVGVVKHLRHAGVREDGRPQIFPYWL